MLLPDAKLLGQMSTNAKITDLTLNSQSQDSSIFINLLLEVNVPTSTHPQRKEEGK